MNDLPSPSISPRSAASLRISSSYTSVDNSWNCSLVNLVNFSLADALDDGDSALSAHPRPSPQTVVRRPEPDVPRSSHDARNPFSAFQCTLATSLLSTRLSPGGFNPLPPPPGRLLELDDAPFIRLEEAPNEVEMGIAGREGENCDPPY